MAAGLIVVYFKAHQNTLTMCNITNIDPNTGKPFKTFREQQLWKDLDHFIKTGEHPNRQKKKAATLANRGYLQR